MVGGVKRSAAAATILKRYRQHQANSHSVAAMASATDQLNRPLGVLRLSLTARCNLACPYCLPDGMEPPGLLTLEQRLQSCLAQQPHQAVPLAKEALHNINHPADWELFRKPQP
jgi:sulfatase maturation enzyme AslB (radical SAM superfamily)